MLCINNNFTYNYSNIEHIVIHFKNRNFKHLSLKMLNRSGSVICGDILLILWSAKPVVSAGLQTLLFNNRWRPVETTALLTLLCLVINSPNLFHGSLCSLVKSSCGSPVFTCFQLILLFDFQQTNKYHIRMPSKMCTIQLK